MYMDSYEQSDRLKGCFNELQFQHNLTWYIDYCSKRKKWVCYKKDGTVLGVNDVGYEDLGQFVKMCVQQYCHTYKLSSVRMGDVILAFGGLIVAQVQKGVEEWYKCSYLRSWNTEFNLN